MEVPTEPNKTLKAIYNPDTEDFVWEYKDDENITHEVRVPAMEVMLFPTWIANLVATHLTDFIYNKRGQTINPEADKAGIRKEIEDVKVYDHP